MSFESAVIFLPARETRKRTIQAASNGRDLVISARAAEVPPPEAYQFATLGRNPRWKVTACR
jgi:hypothetical protein